MLFLCSIVCTGPTRLTRRPVVGPLLCLLIHYWTLEFDFDNIKCSRHVLREFRPTHLSLPVQLYFTMASANLSSDFYEYEKDYILNAKTFPRESVDRVKTFEMREDDVAVVTYPKAGKELGPSLGHDVVK